MRKHGPLAWIAPAIFVLLAAVALLGGAPAGAAPGAQALPTAAASASVIPAPSVTPVVPPARPTPRPYTGIPKKPSPAIVYTAPALADLTGITLGQVSTGVNVRSGPGAGFAVRRWWPAGRKVLIYAQVAATDGQLWDQVGHYPDPDLYIKAEFVRSLAPLAPAGPVHPGRWIEVNLTQQTLTAFEDGRPVLLAQVSTGTKLHKTPTGTWHITWKVPKKDMSGGDDTPGNKFYNLKDVPWIQYFDDAGDALHAAYWQDDLGTPHSHGCVNLSDANAQWLYLWATRGTPIEIHY
jgi:lipoprotein-anchoring transpeptidase ErfK/SrfK